MAVDETRERKREVRSEETNLVGRPKKKRSNSEISGSSVDSKDSNNSETDPYKVPEEAKEDAVSQVSVRGLAKKRYRNDN